MREPSKSAGTAPIRSISVEALHGKFSYEVDLLSGLDDAVSSPTRLFSANENRLSLIYGGNGTGKTTLLRLLFDGLSAAPDRHHRGSMATIKFQSFVVEFVDGSRVEYQRDGPTDGGFTATITKAGVRTDWTWTPGQSRAPSILETDQGEFTIYDPEEREAAFLTALRSLEVNPVFLTDARNLVSDLVDEDSPRIREHYYGARPSAAFDMDRVVQRERDADLSDALFRVREYLRALILTGAQRGSERSDSVYARLVETIARHDPPRGRPPKSTIPNLKNRVQELDKQVHQFTRFGLLPGPPVRRLITALEKAEAQPSKGRLLEQVLTPYLDGLSERMEELEVGRRAIAGYVDTIDSFLEGKRFGFSPAQGVAISDGDTGEPLDVSALSSGEKQILVLFSDVVALRERSRLFIIDEPELSLNPEWQRKLMPALLASTEGSKMQLISATHSIEIMAKYQSRLRELPR
jgi:energy-coupling factor transporter ATP-binding protein EcfA2